MEKNPHGDRSSSEIKHGFHISTPVLYGCKHVLSTVWFQSQYHNI